MHLCRGETSYGFYLAVLCGDSGTLNGRTVDLVSTLKGPLIEVSLGHFECLRYQETTGF